MEKTGHHHQADYFAEKDLSIILRRVKRKLVLFSKLFLSKRRWRTKHCTIFQIIDQPSARFIIEDKKSTEGCIITVADGAIFHEKHPIRIFKFT